MTASGSVIVIGGGPAGMVCGLMLARAGIGVRLEHAPAFARRRH